MPHPASPQRYGTIPEHCTRVYNRHASDPSLSARCSSGFRTTPSQPQCLASLRLARPRPDESVIQREFPDYPGHEEAQRLWKQEVEAGARAKHKKAFYEQSFGIPANVDGYALLAEADAEAGIRPAALEAIVDSAIALSRGDTPNTVIAMTPP